MTKSLDQDGFQLSSSRAVSEDVFEISDQDRYERLRLIGWWDQIRLKQSRVLVVGAGALGNEVVKNLALVGVGRILIVDCDRVEHSNLSRSVLFRSSHCGRSKAMVAAEMAKELNPDCEIVGRHANVLSDIGLGLVNESDVVIGCVDNREARLWINRMCWKVRTPWIDGGIQEVSGVCKTFVPPHGACYECTMTENDYKLMQLRYSCPLLKREDLQQGKVPTAPTIASLIAALQAQEALKLLHDRPVGQGIGLVFNGDANRFYQTRFPRRENCLSHETYDQVLSLAVGSQTTSVATLMDMAEQSTGWKLSQLELDRDFLLAFHCDACQTRSPVMKCVNRVTLEDGVCTTCRQLRRPETTCFIEKNGFGEELTLGQLGIPEFDMIKLHGSDQSIQVLLEGDRQRAWTDSAVWSETVSHER